MYKILKIAQREFLETIKTKTFLLSIIMTPLLIVGMGFVNSKVANNMKSGVKPARWVSVIDLTGQLETEITEVFNKYNANNTRRPINLAKKDNVDAGVARTIEERKGDVLAGRLTGLLVIEKNALAEQKTEEPSKYYGKTKNIDDLDSFSIIQRLFNEAVVAKRYKQHNLSAALIAELNKPVPLSAVEVGEKESGGGRQGPNVTMIMVPFFFMFLMFMGIMGTSQGMLTSVIEEKNSRVIEVLLAAVSPQELMAGKILGLIGVGLTMIGVWGATAAGAAMYFGMGGLVKPAMLVWFIIFYFLGFMVISSLYAAVGSACNTLKEAQNLLGPITMLVVFPMLVWMPVAQNPNGMMAQILSYFPTTASMIMVLRINADPDLSLIQILGSLAALIVSSGAIVWAAGKIFRTGILMYGKPPTLVELARWVRSR